MGPDSTGAASGDGVVGAAQYYRKDFWSKENLKFIQPHFRLEKSARIINAMAQGRKCDLLDVGCGPATLMRLLRNNVHYYGIDIAIHNPAPNLIEADFLTTPIKFNDKLFDIVLAQGVFEYMATFQEQKFAEIGALLADNGKFVVSYWNFGHWNRRIIEPFSNIQSFNHFHESLASYFNIEKFFPVAHNWHQNEPGRKLVKAAQMHINLNIPLISPVLAVEYFFICSPYSSKGTPRRKQPL